MNHIVASKGILKVGIKLLLSFRYLKTRQVYTLQSSKLLQRIIGHSILNYQPEIMSKFLLLLLLVSHLRLSQPKDDTVEG